MFPFYAAITSTGCHRKNCHCHLNVIVFSLATFIVYFMNFTSNSARSCSIINRWTFYTNTIYYSCNFPNECLFVSVLLIRFRFELKLLRDVQVQAHNCRVPLKILSFMVNIQIFSIKDILYLFRKLFLKILYH